MVTFGERVKARRKELRLTQQELARKSGLSQTTISDIERGRNDGSRDIVPLAKALGKSPEWVLTGRGGHTNLAPGPDIHGHVPLISWVRAGEWSEAHDPHEPGYAEDWLPCPKKNGQHTYALRVRGDSMTAPFGKSYPDGCIIFIDPDKRNPSNGAPASLPSSRAQAR